MRRAARHTVLAILVPVTLGLACVGCDGLTFDLDTIELAGIDAGGDVTDTAPGDVAQPRDGGGDQGLDAELPPDASPDADVTLDGGDAADAPDMPPTCEIPLPINPDSCDPTVAGACPQGGYCNLRFVDMMLQLFCSPEEPGTGVAGDACTGTKDCADTYACFNWSIGGPDPRRQECAKFCVLETGFGCDANEFCTSAEAVPDVEGYGWCTPRCDPYDAAACPAGQTCSVDYNYPAGTCSPEFRCVEIIDSQAEGEPCGPGRDVAACARGLACYEVDIADFQCVRPCDADAACGEGRVCGTPRGPWGLRYCQ